AYTGARLPVPAVCLVSSLVLFPWRAGKVGESLIGLAFGRRLAFAAITFTVASLISSSSYARETRLLLTSFEPFGGRPVNNSDQIALELQATAFRGQDIAVTRCLLPVAYDRA